ncbi:MAG: hypothetical protein DI535_16405 [Citrobacter freundii]|nr:MAG: hypothetical protein DI535_16405 [Citrobacter freundii]
MLQIVSLKVIIHTTGGTYGRTILFKRGLNIIRADNTSGKSSVFGAILYGLGFEEILGNRNDKPLQSVLKSFVKESSDKNARQFNVTQSEIFLEITNGKKFITTKRYVINDKVKPQAIEVLHGRAITNLEGNLERSPMYIHDKGGASDAEVGFHKFLEDFVGTPLPEILNPDGKRVKLFLPLIASAHFIEQKAGWSDFFANIPYYGIREASLKVFEFILNMDVFELASKRQENLNRLKEIEDKWKILFNLLKAAAIRIGGELVGLPENAEILSTQAKPYVRLRRGENIYTFEDLVSSLTAELDSIYTEINAPLNASIDRIENTLENLKTQTDQYEVLYDHLSAEISQEKERNRQYHVQLANISEDIQKNKNAEKLEKLGLQSNLKTATNLCPTCNQHIEDSLLSDHAHIVPMRIEENLQYLDAQKKMVEAFVSNLRERILDMSTKLSSVEEAIKANRSRIRSLKRDLMSDDRLPSQELIERKVTTEREISFLQKNREEIERRFTDISLLSKEYQNAKNSEAILSKEYHSFVDADKILTFEKTFRSLLQKFEFTSKSISSIQISKDKYVPVHEVKIESGVSRQVDIRFESSASDFIRAQWAYYISLLKTSNAKKGNHFKLLVFDEPQQQSSSTNSFKAFLKELEVYKTSQSIVFASFQNSEEDFKEATKDLSEVNIIDFAMKNEMVFSKFPESK